MFDVKMDFMRKARWVLDGHKMPKPTGSTNVGVVSRDSVQIASHMSPLMGWMFVQRIFRTRTCKHRHRRRTM